LDVKINGNRGAQQEISVSTKVSKEIVLFQQEFPFHECDVKKDPTGHPKLESDRKIRLQLPVLSEIRLHPNTSDSLRLRPRNPGFKCWKNCINNREKNFLQVQI